MGAVVNLRRARKAKARGEAAVTAAAKRASFGRTKAQKANDRADRQRAERTLDDARLDR